MRRSVRIPLPGDARRRSTNCLDKSLVEFADFQNFSKIGSYTHGMVETGAEDKTCQISKKVLKK